MSEASSSNNNLPSYKEVKEVKDRYVSLFQEWLHVPGGILKSGAEQSVTKRKPMCMFLEEKWSKLCQDLHGTLVLIHTSHIGPASALSRVCRETAMKMLAWSFSEPEFDYAHLHIACDQRRRDNAKRLKKDAESLLEKLSGDLDSGCIDELNDAILFADSLINEADIYPCTNIPDEAKSKGFKAVTRTAFKRMANNGFDARLLVPQIVDYWIECEAIHTGEGAMQLYELTDYGQSRELNREITCLSRLKSLYPLKTMVSASLVNVFGITGQLPMPKESKDLEKIASEAEQILQRFAQIELE